MREKDADGSTNESGCAVVGVKRARSRDTETGDGQKRAKEVYFSRRFKAEMADDSHTDASAGPAKTIPTPWPPTIPYVSWLVWDPSIPISIILQFSTYAPWPGIEGRVEGDEQLPRELVATQHFPRGAVVGPVGGLVVPAESAVQQGRLFGFPWLILPELRSEGDDGAPLAPLALIVTNEFSCCRGISGRPRRVDQPTADIPCGSASGNIDLTYLRDELGTCFVAAVATRPIYPYEELVLCASPREDIEKM
jgi:hypothetical protein